MYEILYTVLHILLQYMYYTALYYIPWEYTIQILPGPDTPLEDMFGRCWKLFLVGGLNPSEKYEFVNWDDEIPNIWENKKCSKPPMSVSYRNVQFAMRGPISKEDVAGSATSKAMNFEPELFSGH